MITLAARLPRYEAVAEFALPSLGQLGLQPGRGVRCSVECLRAHKLAGPLEVDLQAKLKYGSLGTTEVTVKPFDTDATPPSVANIFQKSLFDAKETKQYLTRFPSLTYEDSFFALKLPRRTSIVANKAGLWESIGLKHYVQVVTRPAAGDDAEVSLPGFTNASDEDVVIQGSGSIPPVFSLRERAANKNLDISDPLTLTVKNIDSVVEDLDLPPEHNLSAAAVATAVNTAVGEVLDRFNLSGSLLRVTATNRAVVVTGRVLENVTDMELKFQFSEDIKFHEKGIQIPNDNRWLKFDFTEAKTYYHIAQSGSAVDLSVYCPIMLLGFSGDVRSAVAHTPNQGYASLLGFVNSGSDVRVSSFEIPGNASQSLKVKFIATDLEPLKLSFDVRMILALRLDLSEENFLNVPGVSASYGIEGYGGDNGDHDDPGREDRARKRGNPGKKPVRKTKKEKQSAV